MHGEIGGGDVDGTIKWRSEKFAGAIGGGGGVDLSNSGVDRPNSGVDLSNSGFRNLSKG